MKYKVGDRVRVRRDLIENSYYGNLKFRPFMNLHCGATSEIYAVHSEDCLYKLECSGYFWSEEMLEPAPEPKSEPKPPVSQYVLTITVTGKNIKGAGVATGEISTAEIILALEAHKLEMLNRASDNVEDADD